MRKTSNDRSRTARSTALLRSAGVVALAAAAIFSLLPTTASARSAAALKLDVTVSDDGSVTDFTDLVPAASRAGESAFKAPDLLPVELPDAAQVDLGTKPGSKSATDGMISVIGTDGRTQVTNTTAWPYRAMVAISTDIGGCTGWLFGPDIVATAGHCIYNEDTNMWATRSTVVVAPGYNGDVAPYGTCGASRLLSVTGWTSSEDPRYDYGAIKLDCTVGNTTGWLGYYYNDASRIGQTMRITGYPSDKPSWTMWTMAGTIRDETTRHLMYAIDTFSGQSGSAIYHSLSTSYCSGVCSNGIHTMPVGSVDEDYNSGTRINSAVYNNLYNWKYNT